MPPDMVINVGSPMAEVLNHYGPKIDASDVLKRLGLSERQYFVVSAHREENVDPEDSFKRLIALINHIAEHHGQPVIVSAHPRTRKRIEAFGATFHSGVELLKPLAFTDYVKLQTSAAAVLSDSGTISEESSILNFPALNLRECQERHEAVEQGSVMMVGLNIDRVMQGLAILRNQARGSIRSLDLVRDYAPLNVSEKVVRIVHSHTDFVNRVVWKRY
jgi:UDP-N-acetylglucosamine 2-epimerase (non-hydrolysing)